MENVEKTPGKLLTPKRPRTSGSSGDKLKKKFCERLEHAGSYKSSVSSLLGGTGDRSWTEEVEEDMDELEEIVDVRAGEGGVEDTDEETTDPGWVTSAAAGREGECTEECPGPLGDEASEPEDGAPSIHQGRRGGFEARAGDWRCPKTGCSNWNFSWRTACHRCEVERPGRVEGEDDDGGRPRKTWAERAKSAFLVTVTGGGENLAPLMREQHWRVMEKLEDEIFQENSVFPPAIDWTSWNRKSMVACADRRTVDWIKAVIPTIDDGLGAWLPDEGPYARRKFRVKIPLPTGNRPSTEIMDRIVVGNKLDGLLTEISKSRTERALILVLAADSEMVMSLENSNFKAYCGVTRITFKEEGGSPGPPVDVNERAEPGGCPREEPKKNKKD